MKTTKAIRQRKNGKSRDFEMENGKENKTGYRVEQDSIGAKDIPGMYITGYSHCVLRRISVLPG